MVQPTSIPVKIDTAIDNIDWDKVMQEGAESLAKGIGGALGTAVGGPIGTVIGQAFVSALFGQNADPVAEMQKQILERLNVIEKKLDSFILYVKNEMPQIMRQQVDDALLNQLKISLKAKSESAAQLLLIIYGQKSLENSEKILLASKTLELSEIGIQLLLNGKEYLLGALQAYTIALGCYKVLIKFDEHYANGLRTMASTYMALLTPMLEQNSDEISSFIPVERRLLTELGSAKPYETTIPGTHTFSINLTYSGSGFGDPIIPSYLAADTILWVDNDYNLQYSELVRLRPFRNDEVMESIGSSCPWIDTPTYNTIEEAARHALDAYEVAKKLWSYIKLNPARLEFIHSSIDITQCFLQSCKLISIHNAG